MSVCVQESLSVQVAPFGLSGFEQVPSIGSQVPKAWHWSEAVHVTGRPPVQVLPMHRSLWVQALLSLQFVPSSLAGFEQSPVAGAQVPAS